MGSLYFQSVQVMVPCPQGLDIRKKTPCIVYLKSPAPWCGIAILVKSVCVRDGSRIVDPHANGLRYPCIPSKSVFLVKAKTSRFWHIEEIRTRYYRENDRNFATVLFCFHKNCDFIKRCWNYENGFILKIGRNSENWSILKIIYNIYKIIYKIYKIIYKIYK